MKLLENKKGTEDAYFCSFRMRLRQPCCIFTRLPNAIFPHNFFSPHNLIHSSKMVRSAMPRSRHEPLKSAYFFTLVFVALLPLLFDIVFSDTPWYLSTRNVLKEWISKDVDKDALSHDYVALGEIYQKEGNEIKAEKNFRAAIFIQQQNKNAKTARIYFELAIS